MKSNLPVLAIALSVTNPTSAALTSVLDWAGDPSNSGGTITDTTIGGSDIDTSVGGPLESISDGVFDPAVSISQMAPFSYLTNTQVSSGDAGPGPTSPVPVIVFDLGVDSIISGYQIWNYRDGSNDAHMLNDFTLAFATSSEGPGGFGTSISDLTANVSDANTDGPQSMAPITARYIEFALLSRHDGRRVGVEEIQFDLRPVPEPSSVMLAALGLLAVTRRVRWRKRVMGDRGFTGS